MIEEKNCRPKLEISTLIPTQDREAWLERCLQSLDRAAQSVKDRVEVCVYVLINGEDPATDERIRQTQLQNCCMRVFQQSRPLNPGAARNRLLQHVTNDWVFFIDDDAFVDADFFERFLEVEKRFPQASVIGGPNLTPLHSNTFQWASGHALASRFGAANSASRYGLHPQASGRCGEEVLILCNLFARVRALKKEPFPEDFMCNEENWMLQELSHKGIELVHSPELFLWHERRPSLPLFLKQIYRYGLGRGLNLRRRPGSFKWQNVIPSLFLVGLVALFIASAWFRDLLWVLYILLIAYVALWGFAAISSLFRKQCPVVSRLLAIPLFPLIHLAYGTGVIQGFFLPPNPVKKKPNPAEEPFGT